MNPAGHPAHEEPVRAMDGGGKPPIVLSPEETSMLRTVLVTCSQLLTRAHHHGPAAGALLADMTRSTDSRRSPGGLLYDLNLAIDYLDFAPAARSPR